jgi:hypothetical protein
MTWRKNLAQNKRRMEDLLKTTEIALTMEDLLDDEDLGADSAPSVPIGVKKLRACLVSRLVKTETQWLDEGCENVPDLPMRGDRDAMMQCTTPHFDGCARASGRALGAAPPPCLTCARLFSLPPPPPPPRARRLVAMMDPGKSWVGRWQGISKLHPNPNPNPNPNPYPNPSH